MFEGLLTGEQFTKVEAMVMKEKRPKEILVKHKSLFLRSITDPKRFERLLNAPFDRQLFYCWLFQSNRYCLQPLILTKHDDVFLMDTGAERSKGQCKGNLLPNTSREVSRLSVPVDPFCLEYPHFLLQHH
jgi:hypothetical protein